MDKKILIIDDEAPIADLIAEFCNTMGYSTQVLNSGKDILNVIKSFHPDLITLDLAMPDIPGTKVLAILRKDEQARHIPVLIISSTIGSLREEPISGDLAPPEGVMPKPIRMEGLRKKIDTVLHAHDKEREQSPKQ